MTNIELIQQSIDKYLTVELPKQVEEAGGWENYYIKEAFKELAEEDIRKMESYGIRLRKYLCKDSTTGEEGNTQKIQRVDK